MCSSTVVYAVRRYHTVEYVLWCGVREYGVAYCSTHTVSTKEGRGRKDTLHYGVYVLTAGPAGIIPHGTHVLSITEYCSTEYVSTERMLVLSKYTLHYGVHVLTAVRME